MQSQCRAICLGTIKETPMPYYIKKKSGQKHKSEQRTWINKLDKVVSLYVRMRDAREFHYRYFRCISCGRILPVADADCGHYVGRAHMSLRFDTRNVNAECRFCNRFSSSHLIGYRQSLVLRLGNMAYKKKYPNMPLDMQQVKRLGEQQVTLLEYEGRQAKKWSVFELQQLYIWFSKQVIAMRDEMGGEK